MVCFLVVLIIALHHSLADGSNERDDSLDEDDSSGDCWTYGDIVRLNPSFGPQMCCSPMPCGVKECWHPPEFTLAFCCRERVCRPSNVAKIQRALDRTAEALPNENASNIAARAAPESLREFLHQRLQGLRLTMAEGMQACNCAYAYAASVLLQQGGAHGAMVDEVLTTEWFTYGIDWVELVVMGWGGLFALLSLPPKRISAQGLATVLSNASSPANGNWHLEFDHGNFLQQFLATKQKEVQEFVTHARMNMWSFSSYASSMRVWGIWQEIWSHVHTNMVSRSLGRKCVATATSTGWGKWIACHPWEYSQGADFSSPLPSAVAQPNATAAVCLLGAPRNVIPTYNELRTKVVMAVEGDAFVYVPFADLLSATLLAELPKIGPAVTAIVAKDVDRDGMEARIHRELQYPELSRVYAEVRGPWRAPMYFQMGSSMWGYHMQHACKKMIEAHESQRGGKYSWVIFARADLLWIHVHPPLSLMDPDFVHVPFGQDNSYYAHGPEPGLNDRHAVIPRKFMQGYLGRWEALVCGSAWNYLRLVAHSGYPINTEQYLLLHLRANAVPIRRFPPIAFVIQCAEGPQCEHLYKGTDLRKQGWTGTAKYWTEVIEVRRTVHDNLHRVQRSEHGWIWMPLQPHSQMWPRSAQQWELHSLAFDCCQSRSGPVSCYTWIFRRRCLCIP